MTYTMWTEEETKLLLSLQLEGKTWGEIGEQLGRHPGAVRSQYRRYVAKRDGAQGATQKETALDVWKSGIEKPSWEEIVAHAQAGAMLQARFNRNQIAAERHIDTKGPIFLVFMSDLHLGSPYTDLDAFLETTALLKADRRFFFFVVGIDLEAAFHWFFDAESVTNQTIPPWMQIEAFRLWLDEMLPRCVGICGDTHADRRLSRHLGDIGLVWRDDMPYFREWGRLTLRVGETPYKFCLSHQYRGHSIYHSLQPCIRMMHDIDPGCDVYTTAHTHRPAYMSARFWPEAYDHEQHLIVCGTFKTGAEAYSLTFGGRGVLGLPTLKLSADRRQIVYYASPQIALEENPLR